MVHNSCSRIVFCILRHGTSVVREHGVVRKSKSKSCALYILAIPTSQCQPLPLKRPLLSLQDHCITYLASNILFKIDYSKIFIFSKHKL